VAALVVMCACVPPPQSLSNAPRVSGYAPAASSAGDSSFVQLLHAVVEAARQPATDSWPLLVDVASFDSAAIRRPGVSFSREDTRNHVLPAGASDLATEALTATWPASIPFREK
jgi:hypothetical protein